MITDEARGEPSPHIHHEAETIVPPPRMKERAAIQRLVLDAPGMRSAVLCNALVYGDGIAPQTESAVIAKLVRQAQEWGRARHIGRGLNRWSTVHLEDLAELYAIALESAPAASFFYVESGEAEMRAVVQAMPIGSASAPPNRLTLSRLRRLGDTASPTTRSARTAGFAVSSAGRSGGGLGLTPSWTGSDGRVRACLPLIRPQWRRASACSGIAMTKSTNPHRTKHLVLLAVAVGYVWAYNGGNYLAFMVGVNALPPFLLAGLRFTVAGVLVLPYAIWRLHRGTWPSLRQSLAAALLGAIMLVGGQSIALWGVQYLPAVVASVFASSAPLFLALFAWTLLRQPLGKLQLAGVGVGFAGLALMAWNSANAGNIKLIGAVAVLGASAAWAGGSLLMNKLKLPTDPVIDLTIQLLSASALLWLITLFTGETSCVRFSQVPFPAWGALAFLVIASTLIGYSVFTWLDRNVSSTLANTYNYVAPVIAMGLSALFLNEPLGWIKVVAAGVALVGVALMVSGGSSQREDKRT